MEQYLGEIRPFAFGRTPQGWLACEGQLLSISNNQALFALLGTTYGGNGTSTFGLPDLRGRVALSVAMAPGSSYPLGSKAGQETVTLTTEQMPTHLHQVNVSDSVNNQAGPANGYLSASATNSTTAPALSRPAYGAFAAPMTTLAPETLASVGSAAPMNNMQPYLTVNYCIATTGIFPSRA